MKAYLDRSTSTHVSVTSGAQSGRSTGVGGAGFGNGDPLAGSLDGVASTGPGSDRRTTTTTSTAAIAVTSPINSQCPGFGPRLSVRSSVTAATSSRSHRARQSDVVHDIREQNRLPAMVEEDRVD